jgi:hypothetical protein
VTEGMNSQSEQLMIQSRKATEWESFYRSIGRDSFKNAVPLLNDVLQKLIVLDTALVGGFVGIKELPIPEWARLLAALGVFISLGFAFYGIYPVSWEPNLDSLREIHDCEVKISNRKSTYLRCSAIALLVGLALGLAGVACRTFVVVPAIPLAT